MFLIAPIGATVTVNKIVYEIELAPSDIIIDR
jgi:hypothetical protein